MLELGKYEKELHEKVGKEVAKNNIDYLICQGERSKWICQGALNFGMEKEKVFFCESLEQVANIINKIKSKQDIILLKASNAMKFSRIIDYLER